MLESSNCELDEVSTMKLTCWYQTHSFTLKNVPSAVCDNRDAPRKCQILF